MPHNHLGQEKSPYLLQHKDNPVHWYAWGDDAFAAARAENKPIFLSIGYSTCYWCHMMEKDSFEWQDVADALNADFISIKVDREEHPDVDALYMDAVVGMTGQGGWPMSVFLTPDLKPFFGGTFFPRQEFLQLLANIAKVWKAEPQKVLQSGDQITQLLRQREATPYGEALDARLLDKAELAFAQTFDATYGGFGGAPKFPPAQGLLFLLQRYARAKKPDTLQMVTATLDAMAAGGIHDKIGGGFHRYSVDERWHEPHYEKMLYDNALLTLAYTAAHRSTGSTLYADVVHSTLGYVLRDLTDSGGGFYAAQDAGDVGKEGEYYKASSEERKTLTPPAIDKKILTSWNGLMIAALATAAEAFNDARYRAAADTAAIFIRTHLYRDSKLLRRSCAGEAKLDGTASDYAMMILGLVALHRATKDTTWLQWAVDLQTTLDQQFWDVKDGGYFSSTAPELLVQQKEFQDGALPSANSISALNLVHLAPLTGKLDYIDRAEKLLKAMSPLMGRYPMAIATGLTALDTWLHKSELMVCEGGVCQPVLSST
jgi:uncharacterized protein YyaL (SSP411 family)